MLPTPIYNIMPIFYLGSGFTLPFSIDNAYAFISGIAFGTAAILIMRARNWI